MLPFNPPKQVFPLLKKKQGDREESSKDKNKSKDKKQKNYSLKVVDKKLKLVLPPIPKKTTTEPNTAKLSSLNFISKINTFLQNLIKSINTKN